MHAPECPDCGETDGLVRDVAGGTDPRFVWRVIRCNNCGAKRKAFTAYLPDSMQDVSLGELSEDRLINHRQNAYARRGKGAYRRTDTLRPATVHIAINIRRAGKRTPKIGHNRRILRGRIIEGYADSRRGFTSIDSQPLYSEEEDATP